MKFRAILICFTLMLFNNYSHAAATNDNNDNFLMIGGVFEGCLVTSYHYKLQSQATLTVEEAVELSNSCSALVKGYAEYKKLPKTHKDLFQQFTLTNGSRKFEMMKTGKATKM